MRNARSIWLFLTTATRDVIPVIVVVAVAVVRLVLVILVDVDFAVVDVLSTGKIKREPLAAIESIGDSGRLYGKWDSLGEIICGGYMGRN